MSIPRFDYHQPESFDELFDLLNRYGEDARYLSGGTALMLLMRAQLLHPPALLSIAKLQGLGGIARQNGAIRIGGLSTHTEINRSPVVRDVLPVLADSFGHIATRRIRNVATIGGNLAHANPHQDPPTSLMAFDATALVCGPNGERRIALGDLFVDYLETSLEHGELLTAIEVPIPDPDARAAFIKYLPRSADDYATVNVAVTLRRSGDHIKRPRIVIGSMGSTPVRAIESEAMLEGQTFSEELLAEAAQASLKRLDPETDFRGSPEYKKRVALVIVKRAIQQAWLSGPMATEQAEG
jgi:carbon-monoxide dehydrogenase medium subunit